MTQFADYLRKLQSGFDTQRAMADAVGITPQRLSRAMQGQGDFPLNVENCLRLAKAANRPPVEVLRAAGKNDVAELLEFLFPRAGKPAITGDERDLLDEWRALNDEERTALRLLIRGRVGEHRKRA